jgi:hypothetical protein
VGAVEARVADVVVDSGLDRVQPQLERRQRREVHDALGRKLVHRHAAGADVFAGGLGDGGAGQEPGALQ